MLRSTVRAVTILLKLKQLSEDKPGTTRVTGASEAVWDIVMWSWDHTGEAALTNGRLISMTPPNVSPKFKGGASKQKAKTPVPYACLPTSQSSVSKAEDQRERDFMGRVLDVDSQLSPTSTRLASLRATTPAKWMFWLEYGGGLRPSEAGPLPLTCTLKPKARLCRALC